MRIVEKTQLMTATEIDRTVQRLAHEIVEKSGGTSNLALIGIRRRGVPLAKRIAQAMRGIDGVDVPVGILDITLYRDDLSKVAAQPVLQSSDIPFPVDDKDLVGSTSADIRRHQPSAGTSGVTPPGPLNATSQRPRLPPVSIGCCGNCERTLAGLQGSR